MTQPPREPNKPITEEQILAAHVGEKRPHNGTVHLAEYDPAWPGLFARHAAWAGQEGMEVRPELCGSNRSDRSRNLTARAS